MQHALLMLTLNVFFLAVKFVYHVMDIRCTWSWPVILWSTISGTCTVPIAATIDPFTIRNLLVYDARLIFAKTFIVGTRSPLAVTFVFTASFIAWKLFAPRNKLEQPMMNLGWMRTCRWSRWRCRRSSSSSLQKSWQCCDCNKRANEKVIHPADMKWDDMDYPSVFIYIS